MPPIPADLHVKIGRRLDEATVAAPAPMALRRSGDDRGHDLGDRDPRRGSVARGKAHAAERAGRVASIRSRSGENAQRCAVARAAACRRRPPLHHATKSLPRSQRRRTDSDALGARDRRRIRAPACNRAEGSPSGERRSCKRRGRGARRGDRRRPRESRTGGPGGGSPKRRRHARPRRQGGSGVDLRRSLVGFRRARDVGGAGPGRVGARAQRDRARRRRDRGSGEGSTTAVLICLIVPRSQYRGDLLRAARPRDRGARSSRPCSHPATTARRFRSRSSRAR